MSECFFCGCVGTHEPLCLGSVEVEPVEPAETRREARASIRPHAARLRLQVEGTIREAGLVGLTCDEVELRTGLVHQTASARVNELRNAGRIVGVGKRPTRSGRAAVVYRVAA